MLAKQSTRQTATARHTDLEGGDNVHGMLGVPPPRELGLLLVVRADGREGLRVGAQEVLAVENDVPEKLELQERERECWRWEKRRRREKLVGDLSGAEQAEG